MDNMQKTIEVSDGCAHLSIKRFQAGLEPREEIDRIGSDVTYSEFFERYLMVNKPCIISREMTKSWKSVQNWVDSESGKPNFQYLKENFGKSKAQVADCNKQYFNAQEKVDMEVKNFLDYWEEYIVNGHLGESPCLYLKDWHFTKEYPNYNAYEWPHLFASDWLNEYWLSKGDDDYKFVYMGPKGSWTPIHADVFTSYSWSANICGRKKWILFPPGSESALKSPNGNLPFLKDLNPDQERHGIYVDQLAGETIFVPTGWHHQVWNMDDTISINHNWMNGCCIENSWNGLKRELVLVENELADCSDMEGWSDQCQLVLKAVAGMDFAELAKFLAFIAQKRLLCLKGEHIDASNKWLLGKNHALFDVKQIHPIVVELIQSTSNIDPETRNVFENVVKLDFNGINNLK